MYRTHRGLRSPRRLSRTLAALTAAALLAGCGAGSGTGREQPAGGGTPTAGAPDGADSGARSGDPGLWVDPDSPAARQAARWEDEGRTEDARTLRLLAEQPIAEWPAGGEGHGARIREVAAAAEADGRTAVFVAYNVPHRDCGSYSRGGAAGADAYRSWIGEFAEGIGDADALVILEPDAVPHLLDGCTALMYRDERLSILADAVARLKEQPRTRVYLDAGNPSWITDPERLTGPLRQAGLEGADGFALNVSNYQATADVVEYGRRLSGLLDGAHFVVDTSRNGNGPLEGGGEEAWCNPPGRALGLPPTTDTGDPLIDAFLWIKRPGESDGECRGGPPAGQWWPEYALGLARRAQG